MALDGVFLGDLYADLPAGLIARFPAGLVTDQVLTGHVLADFVEEEAHVLWVVDIVVAATGFGSQLFQPGIAGLEPGGDRVEDIEADTRLLGKGGHVFA